MYSLQWAFALMAKKPKVSAHISWKNDSSPSAVHSPEWLSAAASDQHVKSNFLKLMRGASRLRKDYE